MPAVSLAHLLQPALTGHYALAGLVVLGWEDALAYVQAAEECQCPVILQAGPGARAHTPVPVIGKMLRYLADQASVDVCVHLDHGMNYDECAAGIDHGFTSLMFDGSKRALSENIDITSAVVETAHRHNISVEGEVGIVGYGGDGRQESSQGTDADEAQKFANETVIDALAVSVGNVHLQTSENDAIDRPNLDLIASKTSVPLVLHGGSGIAHQLRRQLAAETPVCKFNIGTELRMTFGQSLRQSMSDQPKTFDRIDLLKPVIAPLQQQAKQIIQELRFPL